MDADATNHGFENWETGVLFWPKQRGGPALHFWAQSLDWERRASASCEFLAPDTNTRYRAHRPMGPLGSPLGQGPSDRFEFLFPRDFADAPSELWVLTDGRYPVVWEVPGDEHPVVMKRTCFQVKSGALYDCDGNRVSEPLQILLKR